MHGSVAWVNLSKTYETVHYKFHYVLYSGISQPNCFSVTKMPSLLTFLGSKGFYKPIVSKNSKIVADYPPASSLVYDSHIWYALLEFQTMQKELRCSAYTHTSLIHLTKN